MNRAENEAALYEGTLFGTESEDRISEEHLPNIDSVVEDVYDLLRRNAFPEPENISHQLDRLWRQRPRLFNGKMTVNNRGRRSISFRGMSLIPEACSGDGFYPILLSFCGDDDDFSVRLLETVAKVYRSEGVIQTVVFMTSSWSQAEYRLAEDDVIALKAKGVRFLFLGITDSHAFEISI